MENNESGIVREPGLQPEDVKKLAREAKEYVVEIDRLNGQLRELIYRQTIAEQRERRAISRKIDDCLGQKLAYCEMKLGAMAKHLGDREGDLSEIRCLVRELIRANRQITSTLSPPELFDLSFEAAVKEYVKALSSETSVLCCFHDDGRSKPLDMETRLCLFQAAKELIINAVRHAEAINISVGLFRHYDQIEIRVEDDGRGFCTGELASGPRRGFGLARIKEQLEFIGGRLQIESQKGLGTLAAIIAPLRDEVLVLRQPF